jgi:acyl carrier protein
LKVIVFNLGFMANSLENFVDLIRDQFSVKEKELINANTNLKSLNEWSSLQTMIVVNEIDKEYGVILDYEDLKAADSIQQLYNTVQKKQG